MSNNESECNNLLFSPDLLCFSWKELFLICNFSNCVIFHQSDKSLWTKINYQNVDEEILQMAMLIF